MPIKMFPIIPTRGVKPHPMSIPWSVAELAYSVYTANYGRDQTLVGLAERGGFHASEMDQLLPDWRERADVLMRMAKLIKQIIVGEVVWFTGTGECYYEASIPCDAWAKLEELLRA